MSAGKADVSLNLGGNTIDDFSNLCTEQSKQAAEIGQVTSDRATWITLTVPHGNYKQELGFIEAHVRRRTIEGDRADFCAIFDFRVRRGNELVFPVPDAGVGTGKIHADLPLSDTLECQPDQLVFVPIGELLQDGEQRGQVGV